MKAEARVPGEREGPRRVVIVGAGLAGLLAAAILKPALRRARWRVELVGPRPRSAGPAAVSTGPDFTRLLRGAGIDEAVLMRRCAGTYRLANRFDDWFEAGTGHWLPLGQTELRPNGLDLFHYWVRFALSGGDAGAYGDYAVNARLAAAARGPAGPDGRSPVVEAGDYGFHLDRDALLAFLRDLARTEGVRWTEGRVGGVQRDAFGRVTALDLEDGRRVDGDLFLDGTGAAGRLIGTEFGEPWLGAPVDGRESLWLSLPPDPAWIPATAYRGLVAGWIARLPLADRTACRVVAGPGEAAALARSLGTEAAGRIAPLRTGSRAAPWRENVVAIGAASGAIEPLAGLGLSLILAAIGGLIDYLPRGSAEAPLRRAYNSRMGRLHAAARDVVALHHGLVRRPEPFWTKVRAAPITDSLADRLDLYEAAGCIEELPGTFDEAAYFHTLVGAGHLPQRAFAPADLASRHESERFLAAARDRVARLTEAMVPHARHLARIHGPLPEPAAATLRAEPTATDPLAPLRRSEHGARLLDRVLALRQPFGFERSIKAAGGRLQTDRFLLSLHRTALGLDPGRTVTRIAVELGLASRACAEAAAAIAEADILHLGFENGPGGPLYKLYVEWSSNADRCWRAGPQPGERPVIVHRAYKWRPLAVSDPVVTLYHWPCVRGPDEIAQRLELMAGVTGTFALGVAREVMAIVGAQGRGLPHYLEVREEPGPRLSYALNLYATGLTVAAIEDVMHRAFSDLGVPAAETDAALAERRGETLGHVAAGLGRDGMPFVTLYSGVSGQGQER